jgi:dephospho-CoA kinase
VIGLLGGVGSGKSTVARLLARRGARVFDADRIARRVLSSPAVRAAVRRLWGPAAIGRGGRPDRAAIARIVFDDPRALRRLNRLVQPRVVAGLRRAVIRGRRGRRPLVLDVPLLLETPLRRLCTAFAFVEAPAALRARRTSRARGWPLREFARRERFQEDLDLKRRLADVRIDNGGPLAATERQVASLWPTLCGVPRRPSGRRKGDPRRRG